jgi:hypothetical protein
MEPISVTATTIVALAAKKFVENASGEFGKKLAGKIWDVIAARLQGNKRAELALRSVEVDPSDVNIEELARHVADEMHLDENFQTSLEEISLELQKKAIAEQNILMETRVSSKIETGDLGQKSKSPAHQNILCNVEAASITLGDVAQEQ